MEVIYTGLHQTPEQIAETVIQEDADAVGLSILSGAHMTLVPRVVELLREQGADDVIVTVGGTIPADDIPELKELGVAQVFTPGAPTDEIVDFVRGAARPSRTSEPSDPRVAPVSLTNPTKGTAADAPLQRRRHAPTLTQDRAVRLHGRLHATPRSGIRERSPAKRLDDGEIGVGLGVRAGRRVRRQRVALRLQDHRVRPAERRSSVEADSDAVHLTDTMTCTDERRGQQPRTTTRGSTSRAGGRSTTPVMAVLVQPAAARRARAGLERELNP